MGTLMQHKETSLSFFFGGKGNITEPAGKQPHSADWYFFHWIFELSMLRLGWIRKKQIFVLFHRRKCHYFLRKCWGKIKPSKQRTPHTDYKFLPSYHLNLHLACWLLGILVEIILHLHKVFLFLSLSKQRWYIF